MGEFRIGRSRAQHSYPDTPRGGGAFAFARNYASTEQSQNFGAGSFNINWQSIEAPGADPVPGTNVPITPQVTGRIRIIVTGVYRNTTLNMVNVAEIVFVDGNLITEGAETVDGTVDTTNGDATITVVVDTTVTPGSTHQVSIQCAASTASSGVTLELAQIDIQELPVATG